jgi:hypothetical protein
MTTARTTPSRNSMSDSKNSAERSWIGGSSLALEMAESDRDLALVISRLEDFSAKVTTGLDNLDRLGM